MTVKTLTSDQKEQICYWFSHSQYNQKQLAKQYETSERTIARVLAEAGVHSALPRMTAETARIMQLLNTHGLDYVSLEALLTQPRVQEDSQPAPGDEPWRVAELESSLHKGKKLLSLAVGVRAIKNLGSLGTFIRWVAGSNITSKPVTKEQVVAFAMSLPEEEFGLLHSNIITARVARASNTHVQTAMLNLQEKVEQNARDTEELRRK